MQYVGKAIIILNLLIVFACKKQSQPNILILLADDMGYTDPACYGGISNTPNVDHLAADGFKFTNCYAGAPNCSPSRVAILTGRIPARAGMYNYRDPNSAMHLRAEEITLAELLKPKGYQTVHLGKWHLGALGDSSTFDHPQPHEQGFGYSLGTENNAEPSHLNPVNFVRNGTALGEVKGYSCQIVADEFIDWFENRYDPSKPFFHYIAFHEPHKKIASPPELVAKYTHLGKHDAEYMANIEHLDMAIGRMLNYLKENNLYDDTWIFFASDNGPYREDSKGILRGTKSWVYDGGIKVPGIIKMPQSFAGKASFPNEMNTPVWFEDILPTVMELTGTAIPEIKIDGTSIMPLLRGEEIVREKPMFWFFYRTYPEVAMRVGDYNMVGFSNDTALRTHWFSSKDMQFVKEIGFDSFAMYNLAADPSQTNDLRIQKPEKFEEMKSLLLKTFDDLQNDFPDWTDIQPFYAPAAKKKVGD